MATIAEREKITETWITTPKRLFSAATREACASHASSDFDVGVIADLLAAGADPNHLNAAGKAPPGWAEGEDDRRREVQALYRAHGFEGEFKL